MINKLHKQLVHNVASLLRLPAMCMPSFIQRKLLLQGLNQVFQEALSGGEFEFLAGKWLRIEVNDMKLIWCLSYENEALVISNKEVEHDVSFTGNLNDLVLIAGRKEDPDTLFFQRRLQIEGDTELGLEVKNLMDSIEFERMPSAVNLFINELAEFVSKGLQLSDRQHEESHDSSGHITNR